MKADKETGEKIPRKVDGSVMMTFIKIGGLILWLSPFVYLINPNWMAWSKIGLSESIRWLGVGLGIINIFGIYWLFSSIGSGITPTSATRTEHKLVTNGIYKYIRHPLYTFGSSLFISFGMIADNWFIALLGVLAFIGMAIRTPKEEANLIEKFGDEYREYMKRTGRFLPKLF
jgi:protein-S-isoprenylcysteine O-methyltransferase Ste14